MRLIVSLLLFVLGSPFALAQTTQSELETKLVHQPMFLRELWASDSLKFDADGRLVSTSDKTSPLLSSVDIEKVEVQGGRLLLKGKRMALVYHKEESGWVDPKQAVKIEIDGPASGDFAQPLGVIFVKELADLAPAAPDFWQNWLLHGYVEQQREHTSFAKPAGKVSPPRVVRAPEPEFSRNEQREKINGSVVVYLQVEVDGRPSHVRIVRPLGLGFDEKAVQAVGKYRFEPARENGVPIKVEMVVEVNFNIF